MLKQYIYSGEFMLSQVSDSLQQQAQMFFHRDILKVIPVLANTNPHPKPCVCIYRYTHVYRYTFIYI